MRPKDLLMATYDSQKGTVVIGVCQREESICFFGASCRANMAPGAYGDAVTIVPMKGEKHVVALQVVSRKAKGQNDVHHYFFIDVDGSNDKPVNLDEQWISSSDRLAGVGDHAVTVEIDGVRYVGCEYPKYGYEPSGWYVDPNLLCKYLVGKATTEEVKAAAKEFRKDGLWLTQKEQKELQAEVERLNTALVGERNARQNAEQQVRNLERGCEHRSAKIAELQESNGDLHEIAWRLYDAAQSQWFRSSALREAMRAAERAGLNSV